MGARILVGTCSWTDPTLIACGRFYPPGVNSAEGRLRFYAQQFPIVEVDSTYYAPPSERNSALWAARTPEGFVFNVKAYALLTGHPARVERLPALLRRALAPLAEAGKLGAVLFQFPPWFVSSQANAAYVRELPQRLPGRPLAVEFRGGGWLHDEAATETLRLLEDAGLAYVSVDEPQGFRSSTPPVVAASSCS